MTGYSGFSRLLHWLTVALVIGVFGVTYVWDGPRHDGLLLLHRSFGITILALTLIRLAQWLFLPRPAPLPGPRWRRRLAQASHGLLYFLLLLQPALGWGDAMMSGDKVDFYGLGVLPSFLPIDHALGDAFFDLHTALPNVILAVIALHVAGALYHHFVVRDRTLMRMISSR